MFNPVLDYEEKRFLKVKQWVIVRAAVGCGPTLTFFLGSPQVESLVFTLLIPSLPVPLSVPPPPPPAYNL